MTHDSRVILLIKFTSKVTISARKEGALPKKIHLVKRPVKRPVKRTVEFSQPNLTVRFNRSFNRPYFFLGGPPGNRSATEWSIRLVHYLFLTSISELCFCIRRLYCDRTCGFMSTLCSVQPDGPPCTLDDKFTPRRCVKLEPAAIGGQEAGFTQPLRE